MTENVVPAGGVASRRALIVRGGWAGHSPVAATDLFVGFLREQGFVVDIHEVEDGVGPAPYADAARMAELDLIVQCVSISAITDDQVAGLRSAIAAGTGFAGWHGGIIGSFGESHQYLQLVGGVFAAHPPTPFPVDGSNPVEYTHGYTIIDRTHPITAGLADFELTTEQYWVLHDDYLEVLATTTQAADSSQAWSRPITSPAVWTRTWGAGKIFVATPGHSVEVLTDPTVRTIIERGLLWAARPGLAAVATSDVS